MAEAEQDPYVLVDPQEPLACALGVVARQSRITLLEGVQRENKERTYIARAILSDHVPLAGRMVDILARPSHHLFAVSEKKLTIYLHHGGDHAVFFDIVGNPPAHSVEYIDVHVVSRFPSNCFWAARTAISHLLDSLMRLQWMPLTIRRIDLHLEDDEAPLCHQLILPFTCGVRLGPLGGIHQLEFLAPYESLVREAVTTSSPFYRLLCAYRLYEGLGPLRKTLKKLADSEGISERLPKPRSIDIGFLKGFGFADSFALALRNSDDFWKKTGDMRNAAAHFLLDDRDGPLSISDGGSYHVYSLVGAVLLHYSHLDFRDLFLYASKHLAWRLERGSILPTIGNRNAFVLRPDTPGSSGVGQ